MNKKYSVCNEPVFGCQVLTLKEIFLKETQRSNYNKSSRTDNGSDDRLILPIQWIFEIKGRL